MSKFLDSTGLETLWDLIKSAFASSLSINNRTISLKNGKDEILGSTTLPFYGVYFVKGTQTSATDTWTGNLPEVNSLYDGLTIAYFLPYAGSGNATLTLTLGTGTSTTTTQPEPVYYHNETRASTNYGKGSTVVLTWVSNATTGYEAVGSATGRWTRCDYSSNTVPSAYCTTAASTAAKAATCTNYYLLNNSYIHVLISQTNTAKSALTLNINSKGAKPIYINGTASSSTNYSLPTGTYIVFYDGTNYYFNTNGDLPGHINGSSITGTVAVAHGGTGQTSEKNAANAFINALDVNNTTPGRNDYIIAQYTNGGTTTTTYYRKTVEKLFKALNSSDIITALGYEPPIEKALVHGSDVFSRPLVTTIRPNKLVLLPADQIIIEETTDGGSTWVDAGYTDDQKRKLFLGTIGDYLIKIPLLNGVRSKLCGIRITITAMKYNVPSGTAETSKYNYWNSNYIKSKERYCSLRELYVWCNAVNDKLSMKVEYASGEQSTNWITAVDVKNLSGWSGGNVVNWFTDKTFGGTTSQTKYYWNWRMTFFTDGINGGDLSTTSNTQQQSVSRICGYGSSAWDTPNYLMAHDHLYTWDFDQNATFPAQITATKFNGEATSATTANKWASEQPVYVTLGTASKTTTIQGGSSTAQTIGVDGVLGVANGGTGLTASPSMLTNLGSTSAANVLQASPRPGVTGTLSVGNGGTGQTSAKNASNAFINALDTETTALQDGDYFIAQTAGGGTTTTTYKRKPLSALETYIRSATVDYFTCDTASGTVTKNVTVNKTLRYYEGAEFIVKFTNGNTAANPTFSVNSLTARPIYLNGLPVPTDYIKSGDIVRFVYHDTSFDIIDRGLDTIKAYDNHIRYYIHRTDGSDTNDGLTTNTSFKTIEKFLEVTANAGYTDCRCTILKDGTYVLNKQALNNVTLHIKVDDSVNGDVILQGNYNVPEDWIMYNAHVKLTGTANAPIVYQPYSTQGIYFENSAVTLDYVKFKCRMQGFGCYIKADNIEANTLHFSGCTGYLATVAITNNSHTRHGILLDRGCNMRVSGAFTIGALTDGVASSDSNKDKNYFLNIQDSDIVLQSSYPTTLYNFNNNSTIDITNNSNRTTYSYAYGMRLSNAEITGTRIRLASYVSRGVNKTMLADEESDINVTWGGGSGDSANGRAGFNSLYGFESIVLNTDATDLISASAIKTWTIPKATIVSAVASDHPNVGTSAYPYKILAVVPVSTSDNRVIIKNSTVDSTTGDITVVGRNVTSSKLQNLGIFATVSILYTMSPFSITYHS